MKKNYDKSLSYKMRLLLAYKDVLRNHSSFVFNKYSSEYRTHQNEAAHRLKDKWQAASEGGKPVEVAFLITIPGMWKVDYLFKAMEKDCHYHPYAVIYPYSVFKGFSKEETETTLEKTRAFIESKGFEYVIPRGNDGKWQDITKTLKPDIVFFSTPYKDIPPQYYIYNFKDTFNCYVPYGLTIMNTYKNNYDLIFHNLTGVYFLESAFNKKMAQKYARNHGSNVEVVGYLPSEVFLRPDYSPADVWKKQEKPKKRVIWAPHHTIETETDWSMFLSCCDDMVELAKKYKESIQFAFKPHQLLKFKLVQLWGEEKTDFYYRQWSEMENTQLEESSYVDLFLTSDAMIHDSGSFTLEYLFTQKPVMYLAKSEAFKDRFSEEGAKAFMCHYLGRSVQEIDGFLENVVLEGKDDKEKDRKLFYNTVLRPDDSVLPSEKVLQILHDKIFEN
ncbi:MAG: CDP-glycerol glycerophosphotransferase family protein [Bacteroidales bacterium]|nr:CDP-glycerol glycerophosphotransferase family protein [Bacteroidales bacterium]